jgi:exodeoxyribonuclease VII large subunit
MPERISFLFYRGFFSPMSTAILSVSELTRHIKNELESLFPRVSVRGEISNCKRHNSGHIYLTLKDEGAQIPAVIWKHLAGRLAADLRDGQTVVAEGRLEVYPPSGRYQLICTSVTDAGEGALQQAFALLLQKLSKAGYFSAERKRAMPKIPKTIGIITSPTGAVIEDMGNTFHRRFPAVSLRLFPVRVQGTEAAEEICSAIRYFNNIREPDLRPDLLIVARGGGSMEDLQPFNEEIVADAIYNSHIPVISAVGHETDITIADMVSDLRAGTPSIAAELAVPDRSELLRMIENLQNRQGTLLQAKLAGAELEIDSLRNSYAFNRPLLHMKQCDDLLANLERQMEQSVRTGYLQTAQRYLSARQHLSLLDYRKTLARGYALVKKEGAVVTSAQCLHLQDRTELLFHDGSVTAVVTEPVRS